MLLPPAPLWGGVGGGGRAVWHFSATASRPPTPALPQSKPRIRGFRPLDGAIEIGNSRFRLGGGSRQRRVPRLLLLLHIEASRLMKPVRLPPGRGRLATKPSPTGSDTAPKTIGIVRVSRRSAAVAGV